MCSSCLRPFSQCRSEIQSDVDRVECFRLTLRYFDDVSTIVSSFTISSQTTPWCTCSQKTSVPTIYLHMHIYILLTLISLRYCIVFRYTLYYFVYFILQDCTCCFMAMTYFYSCIFTFAMCHYILLTYLLTYLLILWCFFAVLTPVFYFLIVNLSFQSLSLNNEQYIRVMNALSVVRSLDLPRRPRYCTC